MSATASSSGEGNKVFPLRLCEILEKEFVALRGPLPAAADWLLAEEDLRADEVCALLRASVGDPTPGPVGILRTKLEAAGLQPACRDGQGLRQALNRLLQTREEIYDCTLLEPDAPARQLAELRSSRGRRSAEGGLGNSAEEWTQLNRLLLESAFPASAVARVDRVRLNRLFSRIHALAGPDAMYSALCLSGGGIRSAAFGLGLLQGLARIGVLDKFDYLSTVSGGGYVGSWLSAWIHRHPLGLKGVVDEMAKPCAAAAGNFSRKVDPQPAPVRFLRSYSHFLNPRAGLFSVDTWTWLGIYLRNLALNWLVLIPLLMLLLAAPRLHASLLLAAGSMTQFEVLGSVATVAAALALVCVMLNRPSLSDTATPEGAPRGTQARGWAERLRSRVKRQSWVLILGVLPLLFFCFLLTLLAWGLPQGRTAIALEHAARLLGESPLTEKGSILALVGFDHLAIWGELVVVVAWAASCLILANRDWRKLVGELLVMLGAGLLTWALIAVLADQASLIHRSGQAELQLWADSGHPLVIHTAHLYSVLAVPAVAAAALAGMTLFIGAVSKFKWIEDEDREWWGRYGSWVLAFIVAWSVLGAVAVIGPALLLSYPGTTTAVGGVSGLVAVLLGKSALTAAIAEQAKQSDSKAGRLLFDVLGLNFLALMSILFLALFFALLSLVASALLQALLIGLHEAGQAAGWLGDAARMIFPADQVTRACGHGGAWAWEDLARASVFADPQVHLDIACGTPTRPLLLALAILAVLLAAASLGINLNKFSLHAAYRIRIIRTFLGATRHGERNPNPFTGFDPLDNLQMHELQPGLFRDGDFEDLDAFVSMLQAARDNGKGSPAARLAEFLCSPGHDRYGILGSRLASFRAGTPVLRSLQRDLLESLNRVAESARLDLDPVFLDRAAEKRRDVAGYVANGNFIFANRLLIESAFPREIRKYAFPPPPPHKLIHVVNLTLNLVRGKKLAWQERKAAPFVITPMHSGSYYLGFRETRNYGGKNGISLGTAAAISGAAVSPSMGYSSSPVTALLLTLFNVRLGWWLGNPGVAGSRTYAWSEPGLSLRPLLSEALGLTDDRSPYVYLSDGGHFDNLGLFEMVLRRCRLIVVSDAGADPGYRFQDLGNAVRKIRIDLGIPIEFADMPIHRRTSTDDRSGRYCAIGRIRYAQVDGDGVPDGLLICFKPVLCGREPRDVLDYAVRNEPFPQESTADQFFGESQFESYRQLGQFAVENACGEGTIGASGKAWGTDLVERLRAHTGSEAGGADWLDDWLRREGRAPAGGCRNT